MAKCVPIIIVTYNQLHRFTIPCIESIKKNTDNIEYHLVIVDNGSSDNTVDELRKRYTSEPITVLDVGANLGWSSGNLKGIEFIDKNLNYDQFVLLNSDTLVSSNWLARMVEALKRNEKAVSVIPVERYVRKSIVRDVYHKISRITLIRALSNFSLLGLLKKRGYSILKEEKPKLDKHEFVSLMEVESMNMRLRRRYGDNVEKLKGIGTGYCVLLRKRFKNEMIYFLKHFEEIFPDEQYWSDIRERQQIEYLKALGVYVYHFRGGSGGY